MLQLVGCSGHSDHNSLITVSGSLFFVLFVHTVPSGANIGGDVCSCLFLFAVTAASSELNKLSNTFLQVR